MYDNDDQEPVEELAAAPSAFGFPSQLAPIQRDHEDEEDNVSYVRGYN
jgi:hypothetical protein